MYDKIYEAMVIQEDEDVQKNNLPDASAENKHSMDLHSRAVPYADKGDLDGWLEYADTLGVSTEVATEMYKTALKGKEY